MESIAALNESIAAIGTAGSAEGKGVRSSRRASTAASTKASDFLIVAQQAQDGQAGSEPEQPEKPEVRKPPQKPPKAGTGKDMRLVQNRDDGAAENQRVVLWHKVKRKKVEGWKAPMAKNLSAFLSNHPDHAVYAGQTEGSVDDPEEEQRQLKLKLEELEALKQQQQQQKKKQQPLGRPPVRFPPRIMRIRSGNLTRGSWRVQKGKSWDGHRWVDSDAAQKQEMAAEQATRPAASAGPSVGHGGSWSAAEDSELRDLVEREGEGRWQAKAAVFSADRSKDSLRQRWGVLKLLEEESSVQEAPAATPAQRQKEGGPGSRSLQFVKSDRQCKKCRSGRGWCRRLGEPGHLQPDGSVDQQPAAPPPRHTTPQGPPPRLRAASSQRRAEKRKLREAMEARANWSTQQILLQWGGMASLRDVDRVASSLSGRWVKVKGAADAPAQPEKPEQSEEPLTEAEIKAAEERAYQNEKVAMWNTRTQKKLQGQNRPRRCDVEDFMLRKPDYVRYEGQDLEEESEDGEEPDDDSAAASQPEREQEEEKQEGGSGEEEKNAEEKKEEMGEADAEVVEVQEPKQPDVSDGGAEPPSAVDDPKRAAEQRKEIAAQTTKVQAEGQSSPSGLAQGPQPQLQARLTAAMAATQQGAVPAVPPPKRPRPAEEGQKGDEAEATKEKQQEDDAKTAAEAGLAAKAKEEEEEEEERRRQQLEAETAKRKAAEQAQAAATAEAERRSAEAAAAAAAAKRKAMEQREKAALEERERAEAAAKAEEEQERANRLATEQAAAAEAAEKAAAERAAAEACAAAEADAAAVAAAEAASTAKVPAPALAPSAPERAEGTGTRLIVSWDAAETESLRLMIEQGGSGQWDAKAVLLNSRFHNGRTGKALAGKYTKMLKAGALSAPAAGEQAKKRPAAGEPASKKKKKKTQDPVASEQQLGIGGGVSLAPLLPPGVRSPPRTDQLGIQPQPSLPAMHVGVRSPAEVAAAVAATAAAAAAQGMPPHVPHPALAAQGRPLYQAVPGMGLAHNSGAPPAATMPLQMPGQAPWPVAGAAAWAAQHPLVGGGALPAAAWSQHNPLAPNPAAAAMAAAAAAGVQRAQGTGLPLLPPSTGRGPPAQVPPQWPPPAPQQMGPQPVPNALNRSPSTAPKPVPSAEAAPSVTVRAGQRLHMKYKVEGNDEWYSGTVKAMRDDGTAFDVLFDDGSLEQGVSVNDPDVAWECSANSAPVSRVSTQLLSSVQPASF